ncbi:MAG: radical SAM protein [Candidatus Hodarchaeota archaeon]
MNIEKIRVSVGSASVLGLGTMVKFKDPPTTCYIMTYKEGYCTANCGFCPQARSSKGSEEMLSRVNWPIFPFKEFLTKLKYLPPLKKFKRICIQTLNYPENFTDLIKIITQIRSNIDVPISVAIPPLSKENLEELKLIGVQRVGIALDGTTPEIFDKIKGDGVNGPYRWDEHLNKMIEALDIFSEGFVSTHLIIGLGETERDVIERIYELHNLKILISLFAFTPIKGTKLEHVNQPSLLSFRKLQLGRYLIVNKDKKLNDFTFNMQGNLININISKLELKNIINDTNAFLTSGCPGCNRPYYTSKPSGPIYNYPRELTEKEKEEIYELLHKIVY